MYGRPIREVLAGILALFALQGAGTSLAAGGFTPEELTPVIAQLESQGLSREFLAPILHDERLQRIDRVITFNVFNPDTAAMYAQFSEPFAIKLAQRFRSRNLASLQRIENRYGVPKEVIVAILLVETQFGTAELRYRPLEVFLTLIVDGTATGIERHYERLKPQYPNLERAFLEERLLKKAQWALGELVAMLSMWDQKRVNDLYDIRGSYAGAFGMPQFLPSSYLAWAVDGNRDQRIDLNDPADAMASIANFLRVHGWKSEAPDEVNSRVIWEYNRSPHYVRTIMGVAKRIGQPARPARAPLVPPIQNGPAEPAEPITLAPALQMPPSAVAVVPETPDPLGPPQY